MLYGLLAACGIDDRGSVLVHEALSAEGDNVLLCVGAGADDHSRVRRVSADALLGVATVEVDRKQCVSQRGAVARAFTQMKSLLFFVFWNAAHRHVPSSLTKTNVCTLS